MQLVAYGAQDVYLTGNPQITFVTKGTKVGNQNKVHIYSDISDDKNSARVAISEGFPILPKGIWALIFLFISSVLGNTFLNIGVSIQPGLIILALIPLESSSKLILAFIPFRAALDAA